MAAPTVTLAPASGPAGTVVTVTVVRDVPPTPVTVTATTPMGAATGTFNLIETLTVAAQGHTLTVVSDDGLTYVATFAA